MPDVPAQTRAIRARRKMGTFRPIAVGILTIALFAGGAVAWSTLAPIESAAIAPGFVSVESNRKTIKHLEGGIIRSILVREGQKVQRGQKMIVLDSTQVRVNLKRLRGRLLALRAMETRLITENSGHDTIIFPSSVFSGGNGWKHDEVELAKVLDGEIGIFKTRRQALASRIALLKQQNSQIHDQIKGFKNDMVSKRKQLRVISEEIKIYEGLFRKGLTQKPRLLELELRKAELEGDRIKSETSIVQAKHKLNETGLRITDLRGERRKEISERLREVQTQILEQLARINSAEEVLQRAVVTAPLDGTVVALKIHTIGGVVRSGDPLLEIVPIGDRLLVDAQINPRDIDVVHPGLSAQVHFVPFRKRHLQPLQGKVMSVSADRLIDERSGESYYLARIEMAVTPDVKLKKNTLYPGMPAEVMIITGTRTTFDYMFDPIVRSFNLAFREK